MTEMNAAFLYFQLPTAAARVLLTRYWGVYLQMISYTALCMAIADADVSRPIHDTQVDRNLTCHHDPSPSGTEFPDTGWPIFGLILAFPSLLSCVLSA